MDHQCYIPSKSIRLRNRASLNWHALLQISELFSNLFGNRCYCDPDSPLFSSFCLTSACLINMCWTGKRLVNMCSIGNVDITSVEVTCCIDVVLFRHWTTLYDRSASVWCWGRSLRVAVSPPWPKPAYNYGHSVNSWNCIRNLGRTGVPAVGRDTDRGREIEHADASSIQPGIWFPVQGDRSAASPAWGGVRLCHAEASRSNYQPSRRAVDRSGLGNVISVYVECVQVQRIVLIKGVTGARVNLTTSYCSNNQADKYTQISNLYD